MKKQAFTLIELIVTLSVGSTLMIMAIGLVHQTMSLASASRDHSNHHHALDRLAIEFRHDVHRATECTVESSERIRLTMHGEKSVTYDAKGNRVIREEPLDANRIRRETFKLNDASTAEFESSREPIRAALMVLRKSPASERELVQPKTERMVVAVVGRRIAHEQGSTYRQGEVAP